MFNNLLKTIKEKVSLFITALVMFFSSCNTKAYASGLMGTKLYTGTLSLLKDGTTAMLILVPVAGILWFAFLQFRKTTAEMQEQAQFGKQQKQIIVGILIAELLAGILTAVFSHYYGVSLNIE